MLIWVIQKSLYHLVVSRLLFDYDIAIESFFFDKVKKRLQVLFKNANMIHLYFRADVKNGDKSNPHSDFETRFQ
jgi:hypothetical protein